MGTNFSIASGETGGNERLIFDPEMGRTTRRRDTANETKNPLSVKYSDATRASILMIDTWNNAWVWGEFDPCGVGRWGQFTTGFTGGY